MRGLLRRRADPPALARGRSLLVLAGGRRRAVVFAVTAWNTRPVSEAEQAAGGAAGRAERPAAVHRSASSERASQAPGALRRGRPPTQCGSPGHGAPQADWFGTRQPSASTTSAAGSGLVVATILAMLLLLLGATFAGHDWNSGSMSNQLLFEPRRGRVWAAKAGVDPARRPACVAGRVLLIFWAGCGGSASSAGSPSRRGRSRDVGTQALRGDAGRGASPHWAATR